MKREDVEALLRKAENPITGYQTETCIGLPDLAALCRRWLAVEDAPVGRLAIGRNDCDAADMVEIVIDPNRVSHLQYQRVRMLPAMAAEGRDG